MSKVKADKYFQISWEVKGEIAGEGKEGLEE